MSDPAGVQAIKTCIYVTFPGDDGEAHEIGFRMEVETPAGSPIEVLISYDPSQGVIELDEHDPAYANALAFADSLRRLAMSVKFLPLKQGGSA